MFLFQRAYKRYAIAKEHFQISVVTTFFACISCLLCRACNWVVMIVY